MRNTDGQPAACSAGGFDFELSIFTLMLAWGVTEVIRYAFYASKELGGTPFAILWLRYTTFIFLYPLGVSSELGLVWMVLPALKRSGLWCYPMPNALNFAFDYYWFCILVAVGYIPGVCHAPLHSCIVCQVSLFSTLCQPLSVTLTKSDSSLFVTVRRCLRPCAAALP